MKAITLGCLAAAVLCAVPEIAEARRVVVTRAPRGAIVVERGVPVRRVHRRHRARPHRRAVWVKGHWAWRHGRRVWVPAHWRR